MKLRKLLTAGALTVASLAAGTAANAAITADMVWVIDISGSMGDDIAQVKQRIVEFNTVMTDNSIDAQYALVVFGGNPVLRQQLTDFATFTAIGSPFNLTTANGGGTEDGSLALQLGLSSVNFRQDSVRNFVLVTDEDDDNAGNRPALAAALAATVESELINIIGNPNDDTNNYYRDLAPANGGAFFNINDFRANPGPFFTNFIPRSSSASSLMRDLSRVMGGTIVLSFAPWISAAATRPAPSGTHRVRLFSAWCASRALQLPRCITTARSPPARSPPSSPRPWRQSRTAGCAPAASSPALRP
jgi:lysophospholipase L1-like esterase